MGDFPRSKVFSLYSHAYFHAGRSNTVDGRFQSEEVADKDWLYEVHSIDAYCHDILSSVSKGCGCSGHVDKFQDRASVDVAHWVCIAGKHLDCYRRLGGTDWLFGSLGSSAGLGC